MDCFVAYAPRNDDNPRRQCAHSTRSSSLRKAGTHTPCSIVFGAQAETFVSTSAGGYGSLLSQGRRWRSNIPGISAVIASQRGAHSRDPLARNDVAMVLDTP